MCCLLLLFGFESRAGKDAETARHPRAPRCTDHSRAPAPARCTPPASSVPCSACGCASRAATLAYPLAAVHGPHRSRQAARTSVAEDREDRRRREERCERESLAVVLITSQPHLPSASPPSCVGRAAHASSTSREEEEGRKKKRQTYGPVHKV